MASQIKCNLITARTIPQGRALEGSKHSDEYTRAAGIVELDPEDIKKLKIYTGTVVKVTTAFGSVNVRAVISTNAPHPGLAVIPMGPWGNHILSVDIYSVGMPSFKGVEATIEQAAPGEKVLSALELMHVLNK
ncbi:MAG: molybdopterin dinucleotide-binding protein [Candidatus Helarchaeota archaeon]|nr:molybdopterin dinucleotide-binding protein [Candidatus Helarchaeota archaeon]